MSDPETGIPSYQVSVDAFIATSEVGDFFFNGFIVCRGCGAAVPSTIQPALKAHVMTCEPLRRHR